MNQKRQIFIFSLVLIAILASSFVWFKNQSVSQENPTNNISSNTLEFGSDRDYKNQNGAKISVVASFYPLYEFSKQTGGDLINVSNITPAGVEPHDFEPSSQQIAQIQNAKMFVFNGGGVDPWAEKIAFELQNKGVRVLNMSDLLKSDLIQFEQKNMIKDQKSQANVGFDPHIWLDPILAQKEIKAIEQILSEIDPKNETIYQNNAKNYTQKLVALDTNFKNLGSSCSQKTVVSSHNAFGYLAKRYSFEVVSVSGLSPDVEPSLQDLAKTIELVKAKQIKYIAFETLVSPKISQTIAAETGATTIVLDPIEGLTQVEIDDGRDYISVMQTNLDSLATILECK